MRGWPGSDGRPMLARLGRRHPVVFKAVRLGRRHRTLLALAGGVLAVVPAVVAVQSAAGWMAGSATVHTRNLALQGGYDPRDPLIEQVAVDGSLPDSPVPLPLPAYELPDGPLGIPATALAAYKNAADVLAKEQPGCHIDWALIASIGRIESNHARGGYVNVQGTTLEPILGPQLNGTGGFAAIPDTDHGVLDHDTTWDRAVGPMQFIPATWQHYAADGNGDGVSDPGNLFDASLATGRYLCSGGLDLSKPDQLRAAIYRYNASDTYVNTVLLWADAYRKGVLQLPDSTVPIGAPNAAAAPPPPAVPPPPPPPSAVISGGPTPPPSTGTATSTTPGTPSSTCVPPSATTTTTVTTSSPSTTPSPTGATTTPPPPPKKCDGGTATTTTTTTTSTSAGTTTTP